MFSAGFPDFPQYSPPAGQGPPPGMGVPQAPTPLGAPTPMAHTPEEQALFELMSEKELIDPSLHRIHSIVEAEINRENNKLEPEYLDIDSTKAVRIMKKVVIPVAKHPTFNFVGKLMGPGGNTLKKMQEKLGVKLSVMGRGSMRVPSQEEECLASGDPKYAHLKERLHIRISASGTPWDAFRKIADALEELKPYMVPDSNDEIVQQQTTELGFNPQNRGGGGGSGGGGGKGRRGMSSRGSRGSPYAQSGPYGMRGRGRGHSGMAPVGMPNGRGFVDGMGMSRNGGIRGPPPHFGGPQSYNQMPRGGFARGAQYDMRGRYPMR